MTFRAIIVDRDADKKQFVRMGTLSEADLTEGDVTVKVEATTVNYKDGLAITGRSPIVQKFPLVPGIDLAGTVTASDNPDWKVGDKVLVNGYGLSERHNGAYSEVAKLKGEWLVPLPSVFTPAQAMAIGTAGYTSMLSVLALEKHGMKPADGPVVVTGASGGVGSVAIALLAKLGWHVIAATGRGHEEGYLRDLGAAEIIAREELSAPGKMLGRERWAAGVDSVGSHTLANVLASTKYRGAVTACGLAQGLDLPGSVAPFILRNVALLGVDSVMAPMAVRREAWDRLAKDLDPGKLEALARKIGFDDIIQTATDILDGKVRGRVVVEM